MIAQAQQSSAMYMEVNSHRYALNVEQIYLLGGGHTSGGKLYNEHKINLDEKDIDEKHCIVTACAGEGAFICDILSNSGTYLNGTRLTPLKKTSVQHGDVMRLGAAANIKFFNEQMETSHNSSGYGEANKNTSDIVCYSPESSVTRPNKSQDDDNNFLVPAIPNHISNIASEKNETSRNCRISFGNQSRQSDNFSIPETQHCKPRTSTSSNLSIDESEVGEGSTMSDLNFDSSAMEDDDFCIPETQDAMPRGQTPCHLENNFDTALNNLNKKSVDLKDPDDEEVEDLDGSQFRICTQDYNDGFGEEEHNDIVQLSQVIPLIKHTSVLLNSTNEMQLPSENIKDKAAQDECSELKNIDWAASLAPKTNQQANNIISTCSTPDLFDFNTFDSNEKGSYKDDEDSRATEVFSSNNANKQSEDKKQENMDSLSDKADKPVLPLSDKLQTSKTFEDMEDFMATQAFPSKNTSNKLNEKDKMQEKMDILSDNDERPFLTLSDKREIHKAVEDEEDLMATQAFPSKNTSNKLTEKGKMQKEEDILSGKDDEPFLTLSDKENLHPDKLDPIKDIPPSHHSPMREAQCSLASTSQRRSGLNQTEPKPNPLPSDTVPASLKGEESINKQLLLASDEEDDILTQVFPLPSKSINMSALALPNNNCLNSTLLDQNDTNKTPASFFDEMEKTVKIVEPSAITVDGFKVPAFKKPSTASTSSKTTVSVDSDIDLLMCTPQLIKDHLQFSQSDKLRKTILATKNKMLFGDDTDDCEDTEDDRNSECLVQLTKVPKDSKDFDKLLPHLKVEEHSLKRRSMLTDKQKAAEEASKQYKFALSFGQEQEKREALSGKSTTRSRDERHLNRDKERAASEKSGKKTEDKKQEKASTRNSKRTKPQEADKCEEATEVPKLKERKLEKYTRAKGKEMEQNTKDTKDETDEKISSKKEKDKNDKKNKKTVKISEKVNDDEIQEAKIEPEKEEQTSKATKTLAEAASTSKATYKKQKDKNNNDNNKKLETSDKGNDNEVQSAKTKPKDLKKNTKDSEQEPELKSKAKVTSTSKKRDELQPEIQPRRRSTRANSHTNSMGENQSTVSKTLSLSSGESHLRSSSRLCKSNSSVVNKAASKSNTSRDETNATAERKRKSQVPVQLEVEEKRIKRTTSMDMKADPSPSKPIKFTPPKYLISTTMLNQEKFNELAPMANGLWAVVKDPIDSNILVMDKAFRTYKFLLAVARGIPIVTSEWLQKLNETKSLRKAPINEFLFKDPEFEKRHKFSLEKTLQMAKDKKGLFKDYIFLMTKRLLPQPIEIKTIIEAAGGVVLTKCPPAPEENHKIYLVSSLDDRKEWHKYRRLNNKIIIISTEAIMSSVMRQDTAALANYELS